MKKIIPNKRLFWFLKEGVKLDIRKQSILDMYIQQIITRGNVDDVKMLLKMFDLWQLREVLKRLYPFIPDEVRRFWEDFIGNNK